MDWITRLITDPGWWFTAVFIAIVASLSAAYLKEWISAVVSRYSTAAAERRRKRLAKNKQVAETMATQPDILTMTLTIRFGILIVHFQLVILLIIVGSLDVLPHTKMLGIEFGALVRLVATPYVAFWIGKGIRYIDGIDVAVDATRVVMDNRLKQLGDEAARRHASE